MQQNIKTWADTQDEENAMNDDHYDLWLQMIKLSVHENLNDKSVLDYGCNQGGFLETLYKQNPYKEAVGVDIATDSLAIARQRLTAKPATFEEVSTLEKYENAFHYAFSHEVLYLISDLTSHAKIINKVLKNNGSYFAAIGCHSNQPQWQNWVKLISEYSNIPVQTYSLDDYAQSFMTAGFKVSVQPYRTEGFFPVKPNNPYFPKVADTIRYYDNDKVLFKFQKQ